MSKLLTYAGSKPSSTFGYVPRFAAQLVVVPVLAVIALPLYLDMATGGRGLLATILGLAPQREVDALRAEVAALRTGTN